MNFKPPTIYARREPTTDDVAIKHLPPKELATCFDTVFYRDPKGQSFYARKPWHHSGHPTKRTKTFTLNCLRYAVKILPKLPYAM